MPSSNGWRPSNSSSPEATVVNISSQLAQADSDVHPDVTVADLYLLFTPPPPTAPPRTAPAGSNWPSGNHDLDGVRQLRLALAKGTRCGCRSASVWTKSDSGERPLAVMPSTSA